MEIAGLVLPGRFRAVGTVKYLGRAVLIALLIGRIFVLERRVRLMRTAVLRSHLRKIRMLGQLVLGG